MKRGKKMVIIIISILVTLCIITWGAITYLGRSQTLSVKSIENLNDDLYLIRLTKPDNVTWEAGSYAQFTLHDVKENAQETTDVISSASMSNDKNKQNSGWLTIASNPNENEIFILTHNSGSFYKKTLTNLQVGSKVEMSWLYSNLSVADGKDPLVFFASDVGIAAIRPIIKEWAGKRDIIISHLDKGVLIFNEEIANLSSFSQSQDSLKNAAEKYGNKATYLLSGQPDDVEMMKRFLEEKGIDSKKIKVDAFKGLK